MERMEELINELENELSKWKRVSEKRLEWANQVVGNVIYLLEKYEFTGDNDIQLLDCEELGLGLRYRGASNVGYFLYLVDLETGNALPPNVKKIDGSSYIGGNFNAYVRYMDTEKTIETIKKLPKWINCVAEKVEGIAKEIEKS